MEIREARESDVPEIILVLKASLGESLIKKSEERWNFKHADNPFGKSLVLVAVENSKIIGVRAFMRWKWQKDEKVFSCYRAVDTATHPHHQGKGIFTKLTLKAINLAKEEGVDFIFNTPNEKSLPGYLKMDWEKVEKLKVDIYPVNPVFWNCKKRPEYSIEKNSTVENLGSLCEKWNQEKRKADILFTPKSVEYLKWRYENNPLQTYEIYACNSFFMAGYIKQHKFVRELRIVELLMENHVDRKEIKTVVNKWIKKFGASIVSNSEDLKEVKTIKFSGNIGPMMTVRNLNLSDSDYRQKLSLNNYKYSLGDLELF